MEGRHHKLYHRASFTHPPLPYHTVSSLSIFISFTMPRSTWKGYFCDHTVLKAVRAMQMGQPSDNSNRIQYFIHPMHTARDRAGPYPVRIQFIIPSLIVFSSCLVSCRAFPFPFPFSFSRWCSRSNHPDASHEPVRRNETSQFNARRTRGTNTTQFVIGG